MPRFLKLVQLLILVLVPLAFLVSRGQGSKTLLVAYYDVGQGDAIFIRTPSEYDILIDGGPDNAVLAELAHDLPLNDRTLDLVVLTHPHADHLTGLLSVLDRYHVGRIIESGVSYSTATYTEWHSAMSDKEIPITIALAGQAIDLPDGTHIEILAPRESMEGQSISNINNASVVMRLTYGGTSFLFTGDAETDVLDDIAATHTVTATVWKVSHHGSRNGIDDSFLNAVDPHYAVISVGEGNRYDHPHPEALAILAAHNIETYRTDQNGTIRMRSDGTTLTIK
ncbi:MAG: MBL fold metallo-hydrolase [Parcubacteria group bacterium]|nr:MBL fold metallo-hydrolase [Parcubacteria group bacterium]